MPSTTSDLDQFDAAHFAFLRAIVQGMDWQDSWQRYLRRGDLPPDEQTLRRTVSAIRSALKAAARRNNRPDAARLVLASLRARGAPTTLPTLAEFVFAENLDGFSESEQLAAYTARHAGSEDRHRRGQLLVARRLAALRWLQDYTKQVPAATDALAHWLDPFPAARLAAAGVNTVGQLVTRFERHGHRWRSGVSGLGAIKAAAIESWYREHAPRLKAALATHAPQQPAALPLLPLAQTDAAVPDHPGLARRPVPPGCLIPATSDGEALRVWLHAKGAGGRVSGIALSAPGWEILLHLSSTQRAYWKEAERFQLWMIHARQSTLSHASPSDCAEYAAFLRNPSPQWCGSRGHEKADPLWRPFAGPLGPTAQRYACSVLRGLYRFLVQKRYVRANPWTAAPALSPAARSDADADTGRAGQVFSATATQRLAAALTALPATSAHHRLGVAVALLQAGALDLQEAVAATADDLRHAPDTRQWHLQLRRGDRVTRHVELPAPLIAALSAYFRHRGLDARLDSPRNRGAALLGRAADASARAPWTPCAQTPFDPAAGIGAGTLRDQLRLFFQSCARACAGSPELAAEFDRATCRSLHARRVPGVVDPPDAADVRDVGDAGGMRRSTGV